LGTLTDDQRRLDVWMDGDCGLCQKSRAWCETHDRNGRVKFTDFRTAGENELPVGREDHEASMWVRDSDGALLEGFDAWRRIMAEIPRWKWVARFASLPPFALIGRPIYRLVAGNRRHFLRKVRRVRDAIRRPAPARRA
jgi:predicted DCC family thiol-disulfide oxidoreductase YuxK